MTKVKIGRCLAVLLAFQAGASNLWADANMEENLYFADIPVVFSASKRSESVAEAPSSVTSWSARDIRGYGYYSLYDLANITPGYTGYSIYGEKAFETRGEKASSFFNNKHLVFVDGIPVNYGRANKAPADNELPVYFAKSVEFLRGPASALYGTGAFYGVVAINSQDLNSNGRLFEQKLSIGSVDQTHRYMANFIDKTDASVAKLSFGYFEKAASRAELGTPTNIDNYFNAIPPGAPAHLQDDQKSVFANTSYEFQQGFLKGFTPGVILLNRTTGVGEFYFGPGAQTRHVERQTFGEVIPYLKYTKDLGKAGSLYTYLKVNQSNEEDIGPNFSATTTTLTNEGTYGDEINTTQGEANVELRTSIGATFSMINGLNYSNKKARWETWTDVEEHKVDESKEAGNVITDSAYSQLRQEIPSLLSGMIITLGARYDAGRATGPGIRYSKLSPRLGVVQKVTDSWTVRVSHGEAIRAPGLIEYDLDGESAPHLLNGLPKLAPETITSNEVGANYHVRGFLASVTAFNNVTKKPLNSGPTFDTLTGFPVNIYTNGTGKFVSNGFEVETRFTVLKSLDVMANTSWAKASDREVGLPKQSLVEVPSLTANLGLTYTIDPANLQLSAVDRYVKDYRVAAGPIPQGSNFLDVNIVKTMSGGGLSFELQGLNVLNHTYYLPQGIGGGASVPDVHLPGRSILATLGYHF